MKRMTKTRMKSRKRIKISNRLRRIKINNERIKRNHYQYCSPNQTTNWQRYKDNVEGDERRRNDFEPTLKLEGINRILIGSKEFSSYSKLKKKYKVNENANNINNFSLYP